MGIVRCFDHVEFDYREVAEVPEDSEDAKKWPLHQPATSSEPAVSAPSAEVLPTAVNSMSTSTSDPRPPTSDDKRPPRPGPRKPKKTLAPLPSTAQKPKKLTTLGMSAMEWRAHVDTIDAPDVKDELDANRRGGGYLEKVEFLQRVEDRKQDVLDASISKRRRP